MGPLLRQVQVDFMKSCPCTATTKSINEEKEVTGTADSGIVMVDGCFMVDGPCVNHAEKAVNHVLWLTGFLGRWLTEPCLMSNFELSGHQFGTILKSFILTFQCASI